MNATLVNVTALAAAIDGLPDDGLAATRRAAAAKFAGLGFPTVGQEDWKYTNLSGAAEISNQWLESMLAGASQAKSAADADAVAAVTGSIDADWIVIRDGIVDGALPEVAGVEISRLSSDMDLLSYADDAMSVFNAALLRDGLHISAAPGAAPTKPLGLLLIDSPSNAVAQTRVIVDAGRNARLQIVECLLSTGSGRQFTNSVTQVSVGPGAAVDCVRIQDRDRNHTGVSRLHAVLDADANFRHNSFDFGGALTRNDVTTDIRGPGAAVTLNGLYLASGEQHIDNHTSILHSTGPSVSREEYRGILGGRSQCVFNGKVVVAEGADGTDSSQSNHNLLLSERAEVDTKPELEIYADDVKCAHGATVGQLDETALFYLRSRGLDEEQARQVITRAFAAGTLGMLVVDACHDYLAECLDRRLEALVGEPQ